MRQCGHEQTIISIVHIERKPHPDGWKVLTLATELVYSQRPYCLHFIPDLTIDSIGNYAALNNFKPIIKKYQLAITADNWFEMLNWIKFNHEIPLTCAVKDSQHDYLWNVFTHDLREHEHRTFTNNQLTATVWTDKAVVKVVSTMFKPFGPDSSMLTPIKAL